MDKAEYILNVIALKSILSNKLDTKCPKERWLWHLARQETRVRVAV